MALQRLTKRVVDNAQPTVSEYTLWDTDVTGFGLRVRPNGALSYVVVYRAGHGRTAPVRRVTLGRVGKLTPDEARSLARKVVGAVAHGQDPAADKTDKRKGLTCKELARIFLDEHVSTKRKPKTAAKYRYILEKIALPDLGGTRADSVTRAAIGKLHLKLRATPTIANYTLAVIGSMYSFAAGRGLVPDGFNPGKRIEKYPEQSRERFLTVEELGRIGEILREAETQGIEWVVNEGKPTAKHLPKAGKRRTVAHPSAVAALRLLMFTGCRLREILNLQWASVDFERGILFLPDSKTGRKPVVLNAPALAVLSSLPRMGAYVVAGNNPEKPRYDLKNIWSNVSRRAELQGVRLHDLRHTYASVGVGAGLGLPIIGKLLGHTQAATTARYAHLDNDPLRKASERIGGEIAAALSGVQPTEVVPMRRRAKGV